MRRSPGSMERDARLEAYLEVTLDLAAAGAHRVADAIGAAELPVECRARIAELHQELHGPFVRSWPSSSDLRPTPPRPWCKASSSGALVAIEHGAPAPELAEAALAFVREGLAGLGGARPLGVRRAR